MRREYQIELRDSILYSITIVRSFPTIEDDKDNDHDDAFKRESNEYFRVR